MFFAFAVNFVSSLLILSCLCMWQLPLENFMMMMMVMMMIY